MVPNAQVHQFVYDDEPAKIPRALEDVRGKRERQPWRARAPLTRHSLYPNPARLNAQPVVNELTNKKRNRIYSYAPYVRILSEGTQPL